MCASIVFAGIAAAINAEVTSSIPEVTHTIVTEAYPFEAMKETELSCPENYQLEDGRCIRTITTAATSHLACPTGYTLVGNTCRSISSTPKDEILECLVPAHRRDDELVSAYAEDGKCKMRVCAPAIPGYTETTPDGTNVVHLPVEACATSIINEIEFTPRYVCPSGTTEIEGECKTTTNPTRKYDCASGTLSGTSCFQDVEAPLEAECEEGYHFSEIVALCVAS